MAASLNKPPSAFRPPMRVNKDRPCSICGHIDWCQFDPIAGLAYCNRTANANGRRFGGAWVHPIAPTPEEYDPARAARAAAEKEIHLTPDDCAARNLFYAEMASSCQLSARDDAQLRSRSLTTEQIRRHGYFTYPSKRDRRALAIRLARFADANVSMVARRWNKDHAQPLSSALLHLPGYFEQGTRGGGAAEYLAGPDMAPAQNFPSLAIPVRNAAGQTIALRLRVYPEDASDGKKKFIWLSKPDKSPSGSPLHVAQPASVTDARVWVTEGEIKANLAADVLGARVISLPGHARWAPTPDTLTEIKATGAVVTEIVIALDQDRDPETAAKVASSTMSLAILLERLGYAVAFATWDAAFKGLDDALVAGIVPTIAPYHAKRTRSAVPALPVVYGSDAVFSTIAEADDRMAALVRDLIPAHWPRGHKANETHVVIATPAVGKSSQILGLLRHYIATGQWPQVRTETGWRDLRVLYLVDNRATLAEQSAKLGAAWKTSHYVEGDTEKSMLVWDRANTFADRLFVMEGRNPAPDSISRCQNPLAQQVASRRQLAIKNVCRVGAKNDEDKCPFFAECETAGYLAAKNAVKQATIVCACKAAYLTESKELIGFDLIILDENTLSFFLDPVTVAPADVTEWRSLLVERDHHQAFAELDRFLYWWQSASNAAIAAGGRYDAHAVPFFRATAPADAPALIAAAQQAARYGDGADRETCRAICEMLFTNDHAIPLRAIHDITTALLAEWDRPDDADSRLLFSPAGSLTYLRPRHALLQRIFTSRVIILDATANTEAIRRVHAAGTAAMDLTPPLVFHTIEVQHHVNVIQMTDSLYGVETLQRNDGTLAVAIDETLAAFAKQVGIDAKQIIHMGRLALDPNAQEGALPEDDVFMSGHMGKDENATNRFYENDCRALATIGNYLPPIGVITAEVEAWRFSPQSHPTGSHLETICYPGKSVGTQRPVHDDPDIAQAITHAFWTHETQALGRLRDIRRPDVALYWFRFNKSPYIPPSSAHQAVPVTTLCTLNQLRHRLGLPAVETCSKTRKAPLHAENNQRHSDASAKCDDAAAALQAEGKPVTATALRKMTGARRDVAVAWVAAHSAAIGQGGTTDGLEEDSNVIRRTPSTNPIHESVPYPLTTGIVLPTTPVGMPLAERIVWLQLQGFEETDAIRHCLNENTARRRASDGPPISPLEGVYAS